MYSHFLSREIRACGWCTERSVLSQAEGLVESVLQLMGLALAVPDHTTLSRRAHAWRSAEKRHGNQVPPAGPLHALVDSTGRQVYGAGQWLEEKHGARSHRGWRKRHLALDAASGEIVAHTLTDQDAGDVSQVAPLLDQIGGPIGQFTADGAYDGKPTYDAVIDHSAAAAIVIPPRANAVEPSDDRPPGQRNRHIAAINSDGRMKWQVSNGYGKHSLLETASGNTSPSSGGVCGPGRCLVSRPKSPPAAPSSTACLVAHTRKPSAARQPHHSQPFQRSPSVQFHIRAPTPGAAADSDMAQAGIHPWTSQWILLQPSPPATGAKCD
ncbi:hypothetical protein M2310_007406 [Rhizobium leguminosarum]|nr:hypothetical protein [Rhizobium leguminosarum]